MEASASDLANYREQVVAIEQALKDDPTNAELVSIRTELLELISLTEALLQQQQPAAAAAPQALVDETTPQKKDTPQPFTSISSSSPTVARLAGSPASPLSASPSSPAHLTTNTAAAAAAAAAASRPVFEEFLPQHKRHQGSQDRHWAVGDKCRALYEGDGKFYEATIVAVGQSGDLFTVEFKGYESSPPSLVRKQDLKPLFEHGHPHQKKRKQDSLTETTAATTPTITEGAGQEKTGGTDTGAALGSPGAGAPKKKKVNKVAVEAQEQIQKQNAWKNFAAKGKKTGVLGKKSMFASPDSPHGKVGVVGSGKGMTQFHQRGKHVYNPDE